MGGEERRGEEDEGQNLQNVQDLQQQTTTNDGTRLTILNMTADFERTISQIQVELVKLLGLHREQRR